MARADLPSTRVADTLHRGMRLFHDGMRDLAMEPLAAVLRNPDGVPAWRLAAAGLLAETYRGKADFRHAEHYYRVALAEADAIPIAERPRNEWYLHYRPRCALGLITSLRRLLSPDHATITRELRTTRDLATHLTIADLSSQLSAVEGVYRRQRGDLDGAASLLGDARDGLATVDGFCYWYPEHVDALLLQVQLLALSGRALVRRNAGALLRSSSVRSWSRAVAAACQLHLQLDRMIGHMTGHDASTAAFAEAIEDHTGDGAGHLLDVLETAAVDEGDPLLESESLILRLAWSCAAGQTDGGAAIASELLSVLARAPLVLSLLRGCEVRALASLFPMAARVQPCFAAVAQRGRQALDELHASIASYGYDAATLAAWRRLLDGEGDGARPSIDGWLDGPLAGLRCLAWP